MKVTYNGVTIDFASVTSWDETVEYDESGMNLVANKIELTIEGSVFPLYYQKGDERFKLGGTTTNVTLEDFDSDVIATNGFGFRLNSCLRNLSIPRQNFGMYNPITGEKYFEAYAEDYFDNPAPEETEASLMIKRRNCDVNGGPKPRNVRVLQSCNEFARISFSIEITKIRCLAGEVRQGEEELGDDPTSGGFVISNRCWTDETIDANFYTTRTFSGILRISSANRSVHYYRDMFYPPLEEGFRRDSVRFSESQDGLKLSYVVTDKQVRCSAPYPATVFSGNCSYSIDNQAVMMLAFSITMVGRPDAPKKALIYRCLEAFTNKIRQINRNKEDKVQAIVQKLNISENLNDPPSVSLQAQAMLTIPDSTKFTPEELITQISIPGLSVLGEPLEWNEITLEGGEKKFEYQRTISDQPNPYGYDVYYVYDSAPQNSVPKEQSGSTGQTGTEGQPENDSSSSDSAEDDNFAATRGFIKCIATAPCVVNPPRYLQDSSFAAEIEAAKKTKAIQDEDDTEYGYVQNSGAQDEAVAFPYSLYKSDISYYTDYSRIVLPKARYVAKSSSSGSGSNSESGTSAEEGTVDYTQLSIAALKKELEKQETSLKAAEDEYDFYRQEAENAGMMTDEEIDAYMKPYQEKITAIKETIATIKKEIESRTCVRVVQVVSALEQYIAIILGPYQLCGFFHIFFGFNCHP